ncbi:MAG: acyl-CoA dehydrogenase family protein [Proteobacteria bacterium]|nr:acyl-CoA dehydrogenase family protein [Pseudomonadota bacterium]MBU1452869.1 acyl-CoA dehydrogenase family protein [Pseudomonadota bacterium]MBU2469761.1 acyl-CoA dehydrogenase family protein [Pseudomonadota bacterium]MBU2516808.1 acyl-CoA dehydrogenase family protein [Pseudomonadota bacterium]
MDYFFTEEQEMIRDLCRQIAEERIKPVRAELDEKEQFPHEIIKALAQADLFQIIIPEEYGGLGGGCLENCIAVEELSKACCGVSTSYAASFLGAYPILLFGSEAQKEKYLPLIGSGEQLCAFALTESASGSDAGSIATEAKKDGDSYVLNGSKQWITNGGEAGVYTVIAITDRSKGARGATAFIVEAGDPGFSVGKKEIKLGIRASATAELIFKDCRIPADRVLGKQGLGFVVAMRTLDKSRPGVGAQAVGLAQGALDEAAAFARVRKQFGKPIITFQAVAHMLADMAIETEAARALVYATARYIDSGAKDFSKVSAIAKVFPTDMAMRTATNAVQVLGGHGYMRDYPVEKMMRDAKILQIYEGTNQIQRNVIGQELNKEYGRGK